MISVRRTGAVLASFYLNLVTDHVCCGLSIRLDGQRILVRGAFTESLGNERKY